MLSRVHGATRVISQSRPRGASVPSAVGGVIAAEVKPPGTAAQAADVSFIMCRALGSVLYVSYALVCPQCLRNEEGA